MKKKKTDAIPDEHKGFVDGYRALLKKYPKAASRYVLADRGTATLAHLVFWECEEFEWDDGTPGFDCRPVLKE
jgi:hypothetical protein